MAIETVHLRLLPYAPEHLLALIEGTRQFEEQVGLSAADGLHDFMVSADVSPAWLARLRAYAPPRRPIRGSMASPSSIG